MPFNCETFTLGLVVPSISIHGTSSSANVAVLSPPPRTAPPHRTSSSADVAVLSQSLFERLQRAGTRVTMLKEQYRMHPDISRCGLNKRV